MCVVLPLETDSDKEIQLGAIHCITNQTESFSHVGEAKNSLPQDSKGWETGQDPLSELRRIEKEKSSAGEVPLKDRLRDSREKNWS